VDGVAGSMQDRFNVFDRAGEPCPRCGAEIVKTRVAQRGTHLCPRCTRR
jgi:formamidopyrimidine-DNA glycosylase